MNAPGCWVGLMDASGGQFGQVNVPGGQGVVKVPECGWAGLGEAPTGEEDGCLVFRTGQHNFLEY